MHTSDNIIDVSLKSKKYLIFVTINNWAFFGSFSFHLLFPAIHVNAGYKIPNSGGILSLAYKTFVKLCNFTICILKDDKYQGNYHDRDEGKRNSHS